ncbi:MAG: protein BatD [Saprospiraceae bacterium]|nr:protein BatD [Saprospiraceae bacterium]
MAQVSFEATTDARQIGIGDIFELKFTLKNAQGTGFSPPDLNDFTVVSGPNRMNSMTIVNGNASNSESITYTLQAQREGNFTIGSATVSSKGKTLRTDPLSILVVKGKRQTRGSGIADAKSGVMVRAEASTTTGYLGQQIIVDYKLYTRVDLNGMNLVREPKYDGFYFLEVNDYPHGENRVKIAGKQYVVRILRRVALFPQREGSITIDPMTVQVGIVKDKVPDPFEDPFFSSFKSENTMVVSDALTINIKPFPQPLPTTFSGAVGNFTAEATLSKSEGTTDDAFSLKLKVVGNGDAKRWLAPKLLSATDGLEFYDPKTLREENIEQQGEWQTIKEFDYLIVPKNASEYTFTPSFYYLNTETGTPEFKNLLNQTFNLRISQGKSQTAAVSTVLKNDILPIKMATFFIDRTSWFMGSLVFWVLVLLPFIFIGFTLIYKK